MDLGLKDKVVVVTGASRGMGAAFVREFVAEGAIVHAVSRNEQSLSDLAKTIDGTGNVTIHPLDLATESGRSQLVATVPVADVLVNNAGDIPGGDVNALSEAEWKASYELKFWGYVELTRRYLEPMRQRGKGTIINNIGIAGERFEPQYVAGSIANAGLVHFTRGLGAWSLDYGVRIIGVNTGTVETELLIGLLRTRAEREFGDGERWEEFKAGYPGQRLASPAEIAAAVVFLASERCAYLTGTIVTIDGGFTQRSVAL